MAFPGSYYVSLMFELMQRPKDAGLKELGNRLSDSEEAMSILRYKGYSGATLADMVRKIPPATLRHS